MTTRVVVVDDQAVVRRGLRMILDAQEDIDVVAEGADGADAVRLACELQPDVLLVDVRMPNVDGIAATERITAAGCRCRIIVLTTYAVDENITAALRAGAAGFFAKTDPPDDLVHAVRAVVTGDAVLGPEALRLVVDHYMSTKTARSSPPAGLQALTARELEVLLELARGRSNQEIATRLYIGEGTVKTHVARILSKLGVRDRIHAVIYCYEHGLVDA